MVKKLLPLLAAGLLSLPSLGQAQESSDSKKLEITAPMSFSGVLGNQLHHSGITLFSPRTENINLVEPVGYAIRAGLNVRNVIFSGDEFDLFTHHRAQQGAREQYGSHTLNGTEVVESGIGYALPVTDDLSLRLGYDVSSYPSGVFREGSDRIAHASVIIGSENVFRADMRMMVNDGFSDQYSMSMRLERMIEFVDDDGQEGFFIPYVGTVYNNNYFGLTGYPGSIIGFELGVKHKDFSIRVDLKRFFATEEIEVGEMFLANSNSIELKLAYDIPLNQNQ